MLYFKQLEIFMVLVESPLQQLPFCQRSFLIWSDFDLMEKLEFKETKKEKTNKQSKRCNFAQNRNVMARQERERTCLTNYITYCATQ